MSHSTGAGSSAWTDLTVPDAEGLKEFCRRVVEWEPSRRFIRPEAEALS